MQTTDRCTDTVGSTRLKLALLAAATLAVPGLAQAGTVGTLSSTYDPIYSNSVTGDTIDVGTPDSKFTTQPTGGLLVLGQNTSTKTSWAASTSNDYNIPDLYASARVTRDAASQFSAFGSAQSQLDYNVEFQNPVSGSVNIFVTAAAEVSADTASATALLVISTPTDPSVVRISAVSNSNPGVGEGAKKAVFDQVVNFQYNVVYNVDMVVAASALASFSNDHEESIGFAAIDPYFDLSNLPDGVTFLESAGIGDELPSTPLPAALPLFATGLGALGLAGWRRKKKAAVT